MAKIENLVEKLVKNLDKLERIPDILMKGGLAYAGFRATNHWTGALTALVSYKLATGNNIAGGAVGAAGLTLIGINNAFAAIREQEGIPGTKAQSVFQP